MFFRARSLKRAVGCCALAAAALVVAAGCGPSGGTGLGIWVVDELVRVYSDRPPAESVIFDPAAESVTLVSARNETVSFQVVAGGLSEDSSLRVDITQLRGPSGPMRGCVVEVFAERFERRLRHCSWYGFHIGQPPPKQMADALLPVSVPVKISLPAGQYRALWFDVYVPPLAEPGDYHAQLRVRIGRRSTTVALRLRVLSFVLPDARHLPVLVADVENLLGGALPQSPDELPSSQQLAKFDGYMKLAHRHRFDLFWRRLHPFLKFDADGQPQVNWGWYDALVGPYLDGNAFADRTPVAIWPLPLWCDWPQPRHLGGLGSSVYRRFVGRYLRACAEHFAQRGWLSAAVVFYGSCGREAIPAGALRSLLQMTRAVRPPVRFMALSASADELEADVLCVPGRLLEPFVSRQKQLWLTPDEPPFVGALDVDSPPVDVAALGWIAYRYGVRGIYVPPPTGRSGDEPMRSPLLADGRRFGVAGAVATIRAKLLRRALQDYEYLWLAEQRGLGKRAAELVAGVVRYAGRRSRRDGRLWPAGWVRNPRTYIYARLLLADAITASLPEPDAPRPFPNHMRAALQRWFEQDCFDVRVQLEDVAVVQRQEQSEPVEMSLKFSITNLNSRPVSGTLRFGQMRRFLVPVLGSVSFTDLPPGASKSAQMTVRGALPPVDAEGIWRVPLVLQALPYRRLIDFRVGWLVPTLLDEAPKLDGRLEDWPLATGNTAGSFLWSAVPVGEPDRDTLVFVGFDKRWLYVAFRCAQKAPPIADASTIVPMRYGLPWSQDAVQVYLTAERALVGVDAGVRAAAGGVGRDIAYRITVKASGVAVAEELRRTDGRWQARPWAVKFDSAVARRPDRWSVELRIDRRSAGLLKRWLGYCRVNFVRHRTDVERTCSWAVQPWSAGEVGQWGLMFLPAGGESP